MKKQGVEKVKTSLQIDEDIRLHEKGWTIQKIGWVFIFLLVITAAFGFYGDGLLSKQNDTVNGIEVQWQKFYRFEARMELKIKSPDNKGRMIVGFPNDYLEQMEIAAIIPEPKENSMQGEVVHYVFDAIGAAHVVFYLIPKRTGSISGSVMVNNQPFTLNHFIYP